MVDLFRRIRSNHFGLRLFWSVAGHVTPPAVLLRAAAGAITSDPRRVARIAVGCLLLTAAGLKSFQQMIPLHGTYWWPLPAFLALLEAMLGVWLVSGIFAQLASTCAVFAFGTFACYSLLQVLDGAASCGCFGHVEVPPWGAVLLDVAALGCLIEMPRGFRDRTSHIAFHVRRPWLCSRALLGTGGALLIVFSTLAATYLSGSTYRVSAGVRVMVAAGARRKHTSETPIASRPVRNIVARHIGPTLLRTTFKPLPHNHMSPVLRLPMAAVCAVCLSTLPLRAADTMTARDAIDALEASIASVTSYDVSLTAHTISHARPVGIGRPPFRPARDGGKQPRVEWQRFPPGQSPTTTSYSRQVRSADGRQRFERLKAPGDDLFEVKVFTGEATRQFSRRHNGGAIKVHGPDKRAFPELNENYAALFREVYHGGELTVLARGRDQPRCYRSNEHPRCVVLELQPQQGAPMYPSFGFRLTLDPSHGFLPCRIDVFRRGLTDRVVRYDVQEFFQPESGVWVPVKAVVHNGWAGFVVQTTTLTVDMGRSGWNEPVPPELFSLPFPPGSTIVDETRGVTFIAGDGDLGGSIDRLLDSAQEVLTAAHPAQPAIHGPGSSVRYVLLAGTAALVVALLLGMYIKRRGAAH